MFNPLDNEELQVLFDVVDVADFTLKRVDLSLQGVDLPLEGIVFRLLLIVVLHVPPHLLPILFILIRLESPHHVLKFSNPLALVIQKGLKVAGLLPELRRDHSHL